MKGGLDLKEEIFMSKAFTNNKQAAGKLILID
jgi:hypothetical protein